MHWQVWNAQAGLQGTGRDVSVGAAWQRAIPVGAAGSSAHSRVIFTSGRRAASSALQASVLPAGAHKVDLLRGTMCTSARLGGRTAGSAAATPRAARLAGRICSSSTHRVHNYAQAHQGLTGCLSALARQLRRTIACQHRCAAPCAPPLPSPGSSRWSISRRVSAVSAVRGAVPH